MSRLALAIWVIICGTVVGSNASVANELTLLLRPPVPNLIGPDVIEPAPVLVLSEERAELDGRRMTAREIELLLRALADKYKSLYGQVAFNGKFILACAPTTPTARLTEYLRAAHSAGYVNPVFLFIRPDPSGKGDSTTDQLTGALVSTVPIRSGRSLKVADYGNCTSLSEAIVDLRTEQKRAVALDFGQSKRKLRP